MDFAFGALVVAATIVVALRAWRRKGGPAIGEAGTFRPPESEVPRLSYEASCSKLQELGLLEAGDIPPLPSRPPQPEDEILGVSFFKTEVSEAVLNQLSLPRTFFGRSLIQKVSLQNADLSESNLCWNDFVDVDFRGASLRKADLRASQFRNVDFSQCDLSGSDLRQSSFENCEFAGASFVGAKVTRDGAANLGLSSAQRAEVDWQSTEGEEPAGG